MKAKYDVDVVIVGAGTAGCYTAWRLAEKGRSVLIVEKKKRKTLGTNVGIFHVDEIRFQQFGIPLPKGKELIGYYPDGLAWPPDGDATKKVSYAFYVMELPLFIERMQGYAEKAGARILFETDYKGPLTSGTRLAGIRVKKGTSTFDIAAKIVIDASGVDASVRTSLPADRGLEIDKIKPSEFLYVILQYWDKIEGKDTGRFPTGLNFYPFHKAFINPSYGKGAIVGIGQPESLQKAEQVQKEFLAERFPDTRHTLVKKTWGRTPFRRPPLSLVADGFMAVGDAAFMTKPFSGEGVTSGFTACQIAAETADAALTAGDFSAKALWPLNTRYFRDQGAKFAGLYAQVPAAAELSRHEVNYLFEKDIIFSSFDFESMNRDFEVKMGPLKLVAVAAKLVAGRLNGGISKKGFDCLMAAMSVAGKIRKHYEGYPAEPAGYPAWEEKARELWGEKR
ncbi:MAG: NAD(P)/FAD-dependent oxidoreductase [Spirochaetes bacterium]|nr:MAG: NAD(P)/FAD-dependent oxidoreductase [Spirochaetota bacterium]